MELSFTPHERSLLLDTARASISHGLSHRAPRPVDPADYPESLRVHRATFVTLRLEDELRGCIGTLEARRPVVEDVSFNAYGAAFRDPRFTPMTAHEFARLHIHLSVLTPPTPMTFTDEADLLRQLRPGVDGLILEFPGHRGTFLPAVWDTLPDPATFLRHLKVKAGLQPDDWPHGIRVSRYAAEDIE